MKAHICRKFELLHKSLLWNPESNTRERKCTGEQYFQVLVVIHLPSDVEVWFKEAARRDIYENRKTKGVKCEIVKKQPILIPLVD